MSYNLKYCAKGSFERARQHRSINEHTLSGFMRLLGFGIGGRKWHDLTPAERSIVRRCMNPKNWTLTRVSEG